MAAYFWKENEREILKKNILAEAYAEVHPDHQDFNDLDEMSSLYQALQTAFGGSSGDYIADKKTIKFNQDEIKVM